MKHVAVVGAGICGSLAAFYLLQKKVAVTVIDPLGWLQAIDCGENNRSTNSVLRASTSAGGMIASESELQNKDLEVQILAHQSLSLWPLILSHLQEGHSSKITDSLYWRQNGILMVALPGAISEMQDHWFYLQKQTEKNHPYMQQPESGSDVTVEKLHRDSLFQLEPHLDPRIQTGLFFAKEAHLNPQATLLRLHQYLQDYGVQIWPRKVESQDYKQFEFIFDTRGFSSQIEGLRPVRGEILFLSCQQTQIHRPVRVLHPRHSIYIVPRPENRYALGASQIESADLSPISVRSTLELLSTAFAAFPSLAEARIEKTSVGLRPTFFNHVPRLRRFENILEINGVYRHGFAIGPALLSKAMDWVFNNKQDMFLRRIYEVDHQWSISRCLDSDSNSAGPIARSEN